MFQFFWNIFRSSGDGETKVWHDDILSHPAIAVMDERQRGDLPMPRASNAPSLDCSQMKGVCRAGSGSISM